MPLPHREHDQFCTNDSSIIRIRLWSSDNTMDSVLVWSGLVGPQPNALNTTLSLRYFIFLRISSVCHGSSQSLSECYCVFQSLVPCSYFCVLWFWPSPVCPSYIKRGLFIFNPYISCKSEQCTHSVFLPLTWNTSTWQLSVKLIFYANHISIDENLLFIQRD